jgi:hypothetical protein
MSHKYLQNLHEPYLDMFNHKYPISKKSIDQYTLFF